MIICALRNSYKWEYEIFHPITSGIKNDNPVDWCRSFAGVRDKGFPEKKWLMRGFADWAGAGWSHSLFRNCSDVDANSAKAKLALHSILGMAILVIVRLFRERGGGNIPDFSVVRSGFLSSRHLSVRLWAVCLRSRSKKRRRNFGVASRRRFWGVSLTACYDNNVNKPCKSGVLRDVAVSVF